MAPSPPPAPEILYEHPGFLAVSKRPGQVVIPARYEDPQQSLWRQLEQTRNERLFAVHRLDRDTSGVVLFGRTAEAHRALSLAFERGQVDKRYLALSRGVPDVQVIEVPLHTARRGKMRPAAPSEEGLRAITEVTVREVFATPLGQLAWLEAHPRTGRQHQIRVHLRAIGTPLLVDPLYGGCDGLGPESLGVALPRTPLHAERIILQEPGGTKTLILEAPLPQDLLQVLAVLRAGRR